jgi:hypothetical protein
MARIELSLTPGEARGHLEHESDTPRIVDLTRQWETFLQQVSSGGGISLVDGKNRRDEERPSPDLIPGRSQREQLG